MAKDALRKMKKTELVALLQEREAEIERLTELLNDREKQSVKFENLGSLAEASLAVNGVFESAQKAADWYLEEVSDMKRQAAQMMVRCETEAKTEAERIVSEARQESEKYQRDRDRIIDEIYTEIKTKLDKYCAAQRELQKVMDEYMNKKQP